MVLRWTRGVNQADVNFVRGVPLVLFATVCVGASIGGTACSEPFSGSCVETQTCTPPEVIGGAAGSSSASVSGESGTAGKQVAGQGGASGGPSASVGGTGGTSALGGHAGSSGTGGTEQSDVTAPSVLSIVPKADATDVPPNTSIVLSFSEWMNTSATSAAITISPPIACVGGWSWTADQMHATCIPQPELAFAASYSVSVGGTAEDLAGNAIDSAFSSTFKTSSAPDKTPPSLVSASPSHDSVGIPTNAKIQVVFSEAMEMSSTQKSFQVLEPSGTSGVFSWSDDGKSLTFDPTSDFAHGQTVKFQVSAGAKDMAGNPKQGTQTFQFRVMRKETKRLNCIKGLTGEVTATGGVRTSESLIIVGSYKMLNARRGFVAFDLSVLPTNISKILSADLGTTLLFHSGDPYRRLGKLVWHHVNFGTSVSADDFDAVPLPHDANIGTIGTFYTEGWNTSSVLQSVQDDWTHRSTRASRSQFRIQFERLYNSETEYYDQVNFQNCGRGDGVEPSIDLTYEYP